MPKRLDAGLSAVDAFVGQAPEESRALMAAKCRGLLVGDHARWADAEYLPVAVERVVQSDLWNPETGRKSRSFTVAGKIDLSAAFRDRVVLIDHKTTAEDISDPNAPYWRQLTRYVRDYIRRNARVKGIISLNSETFEGYGARAKTSILLLQKKGEPDEGTQEPVFMAVAQNTGYAPNGAQIAGNELPDILMAYRSFLKGEKVKSETPACWVANLQDRLDTEFYWVRADGAIRDVATIQTNVGQLLAEVSPYSANRRSRSTIFGHPTRQPLRLDPENLEKGV